MGASNCSSGRTSQLARGGETRIHQQAGRHTWPRRQSKINYNRGPSGISLGEGADQCHLRANPLWQACKYCTASKGGRKKQNYGARARAPASSLEMFSPRLSDLNRNMEKVGGKVLEKPPMPGIPPPPKNPQLTNIRNCIGPHLCPVKTVLRNKCYNRSPS